MRREELVEPFDLAYTGCAERPQGPAYLDC